MSELNLIKANRQDLHVLQPMVRNYHRFESIQMNEQERRKALVTLITNPSYGGVWLIYEKQTLCGYIALCTGFSIEFGGRDAFIDEFYIEPECRGRGLARQTLTLIKEQARKLDIRALHLEVNRSNDRARKLYTDADFKPRPQFNLMSLRLDEIKHDI